jgi:hypothetical protein
VLTMRDCGASGGEVRVFPDQLEVKVAGSPVLTVLLTGVGLKVSENVQVGGASRRDCNHPPALWCCIGVMSAMTGIAVIIFACFEREIGSLARRDQLECEGIGEAIGLN